MKASKSIKFCSIEICALCASLLHLLLYYLMLNFLPQYIHLTEREHDLRESKNCVDFPFFTCIIMMMTKTYCSLSFFANNFTTSGHGFTETVIAFLNWILFLWHTNRAIHNLHFKVTENEN